MRALDRRLRSLERPSTDAVAPMVVLNPTPLDQQASPLGGSAIVVAVFMAVPPPELNIIDVAVLSGR